MQILMFPGQGTQYPKIYNDFKYVNAYRDTFYEASEYLNLDITNICSNLCDNEMKLTENAQLAVFVHNMAIYNILRSYEEINICTVGYSLGQINSFVAAGALDFKSGLEIVRKRSELMSNSPTGGGMFAISGISETFLLEEILNKQLKVYIAIINSETSFVISGILKDILQLKDVLTRKYTVRMTQIAVNRAFHTPIMLPIVQEFKDFISDYKFNDCKIPVILNSTGQFATDARDIKDELVNQITSPVLWKQSMDLMLQKYGHEITYVEVGARKSLTKILLNISPNATIESTNNLEEIYDSIWR
ncbi:ACP S-malonyltransferase [Clostridium gasigenes]|uniref:ACP S-malonyltransferase n=1 Tax=Clostridium gasigenes TaxID=94869 RepID=UPI001C0C21F5|nr:ACP S-malonyltransferase [Clostridium gasigenes]MBU3109296.1 ACP S-malonyltransferase [Clostridium gasigenes]